ncbi:MAG: metallophosphoesterase [Longimicrobiales bacterium]|nr:metallophosphoesterase [Longimicrobiales bacterium]
MQVGVLSDIHDHLENLERALELFSKEGVDTLCFCGDFCSPIPARVLGGYDGVVHCVFGNGDGDRFRMLQAEESGEAGALRLHGEHAELEIGGRRVALTHFPLYGQALARTGDYDAVFSGHTHEAGEERFPDAGECLWVNPGEILGWKGAPTAYLWDTEGNEGRFLEV